jgi:hypothetical protein
MWFIIKKITEEIPLDKIVNRDAFQTLLLQFYGSDHIQNNKE